MTLKLFFGLALSVLTQIANAQTLDLKSLMSMQTCGANNTCFQKVLSSNGFKLKESKSEKGETLYSYESTEVFTWLGEEWKAGVFIHHEASKKETQYRYRFSNDKRYEAFRDSLLKIGYQENTVSEDRHPKYGNTIKVYKPATGNPIELKIANNELLNKVYEWKLISK